MLDFAGAVAINKFERRGGQDALRDVRRQLARTGEHPGVALEELPVFGTVASRFNDDGVTALYQFLRDSPRRSRSPARRRPAARRRRAHVDPGARPSSPRTATATWPTSPRPSAPTTSATDAARPAPPAGASSCGEVAAAAPRPTAARPPPPSVQSWRARADGDADRRPARSCSTPGRPRWRSYRDDKHARPSLSGTPVPRVALPRFTDDGELLRWLRAENLPGEFPYTAGVFPFKREGEDPARMFAGEGDAFRTNRRFHLLSEGQPATRLSTAFDSVTLYGFDPDLRPDIYGKVGNSGVSIATLDDMKALYGGFNLCDPTTSVSMTINGPAPTILAMFLNAAIDDQLARHRGRDGPAAHARRGRGDPGPHPPPGARHRAGRHPQGGPGPEHLHLLDRVLAAGHGRHAGVVHRQPGAQLLLGVDLRLSHRRGGRQPHQPAGLHPGQRLHLRGGLPGPRA